MSLFASFNGGPSSQAVLYALIGGGLTGVLTGAITASTGKGFWRRSFLSAVCAMIVSGLILVGGNEGGDAASLFLIFALVMFIPLSGFLGFVGGILGAGLVIFYKGPTEYTTQAELYWIEGPWPGPLAIMPRPRGGDWLDHEIVSWQHRGIDMVVSTLTGEEIAELDLAREKEACTVRGIAFIAFPFADRGLPPSRKEALELVRRLEQELAAGKKIAIHCRQGVGRSALLAACVLAASGIDPASAWERIAAARRCSVPDTSQQREWVAQFTREMLAPLPGGDSAAKRRERGINPEPL